MSGLTTTEHREEKRHLRERSHTITRHTIPSTTHTEALNDVEEGVSPKHFDTTDDLATINDQIQGLMVPGEEDLQDEDYSDEEDAAPTTGQASPKSLLSTTSSVVSYVSSASAYDILLSRLGNSQVDPFSRTETMDHRIDQDQSSAPRVSQEMKDQDTKDEDADWDFWAKVISDFKSVTTKELSSCIRRGIPSSLRGTIWQLLAKSKDTKLEQTYMQLLNQESVYEKAITRDLSRILPHNQYVQSTSGKDSLFNVAKAYSLYDQAVGYCQDILCIIGPLLLNMPEEETFCVLVQIMHRYGLRDYFLPQSNFLSQRLYQFSVLVSENIPHISRHLEFQGIQDNMYAARWFTSIFACKFPFDFVFRVYDLFLSEGQDVLLRVALAVLNQNQATILALEHDNLSRFLKNDLTEVTETTVDDIIHYTAELCIPNRRLERLAKQYQADAARSNSSDANAIESLRRQNKTLSETVRELQRNLNSLNREHDAIAKELIESKMEIARVHDENDALRQQSFDLKRALEALHVEVESRIKTEMSALSSKNAALMDRNVEQQGRRSRCAHCR